MILFKFVSKEKSSPPVKKTKSSGYLCFISLMYPSISYPMPFSTPARMAVSVSLPNGSKRPSACTSGRCAVRWCNALKRICMPGAMLPPRNVLSAVTKSTVTAVPKSTTMRAGTCGLRTLPGSGHWPPPQPPYGRIPTFGASHTSSPPAAAYPCPAKAMERASL